MRTDGTGMIKLIGAFRDCSNVPTLVQNVVFLCKEVKIRIYRITVFTFVLYGCPRLDGRIILKWNLKKSNCWAWTGLIWLRRGTNVMIL